MACHKDLHSIYIDDEMPENFLPEYKRQVESDSESSSDFERMKKIHDLLNFDAESESSKISDEFMEKSFERLQSKMRFAQTVELAEPKKSSLSFWKFPVSFAAAAAVFAVVFVPLSKRSAGGENMAINAIAHTALKPVADVDVKIDGNIDSEKLPEVFAVVAKADVSKNGGSKSAMAENEASAESLSDGVQQKTIRASTVVSSRTRDFGSQLTSVDVFKSRFSNDNPLQMRVPEFGEIQIQQEN